MTGILTAAALLQQTKNPAPDGTSGFPAGVAYLITNVVNGKRYVGMTRQSPEKRWDAHRRRAQSKQEARALHHAIAKHGVEYFTFEVIASARTRADLCVLEQILVEQHGTFWADGAGYNLTRGGDGQHGRKHSKETRAKMSRTRRGRRHSAEHALAIAAALTGRKLTPEHAQKLGAAQRGHTMPEVTRAALAVGRKKLRGRRQPPEVVAKIKAARAQSGWKPSPEHLEALRQANIRRHAKKREALASEGAA